MLKSIALTASIVLASGMATNVQAQELNVHEYTKELAKLVLVTTKSEIQNDIRESVENALAKFARDEQQENQLIAKKAVDNNKQSAE